VSAVTLLPGPFGADTGVPEDRIAELLAKPATIRSIHRPVVALADGHCLGYEATVRIGDRAARSAAPWFQAAAEAGLSGQLGAIALDAALRERATLPGERFLAVELDPEALGHPDVIAVFDGEDDVSNLVLTLISPEMAPNHPAGPVLDDLRGRGLLLAMNAGTAGLDDLTTVERLGPDLIRISPELVRGVHQHPLRQHLIEVVVELAEDLGASALAEEVETMDEAFALRSTGVRMAQGWLFGRPRPGFAPPSAEISEWLRVLQLEAALIPRQQQPTDTITLPSVDRSWTP
jgi:EAL domain-containing protein (putative c-di-GMP-specific phosphodiesterase class I)